MAPGFTAEPVEGSHSSPDGRVECLASFFFFFFLEEIKSDLLFIITLYKNLQIIDVYRKRAQRNSKWRCNGDNLNLLSPIY